MPSLLMTKDDPEAIVVPICCVWYAFQGQVPINIYPDLKVTTTEKHTSDVYLVID